MGMLGLELAQAVWRDLSEFGGLPAAFGLAALLAAVSCALYLYVCVRPACHRTAAAPPCPAWQRALGRGPLHLCLSLRWPAPWTSDAVCARSIAYHRTACAAHRGSVALVCPLCFPVVAPPAPWTSHAPIIAYPSEAAEQEMRDTPRARMVAKLDAALQRKEKKVSSGVLKSPKEPKKDK